MSAVTLTGTYHNGPGGVCAGTITFQLEQTETDGSSTFIVGTPTTVTLDASGSFSVVLTSTDGLSPTASYRVTERIRDAKQRVFWIQLDASPSTQNLAGLVGYTAPVGTATAVELIVDLVPIAQAAASAAQASQTAAASSASSASASASAAAASAAAAAAPTDAMVASLVPNTGSATGAALLAKYVDRGSLMLSAKDYQVKGDDSTDDTTNLQTAINEAQAAGRWLDLGGMTCKTTGSLSIPAWSMIRNGTIHCTAAATKILNVVGSNPWLSGVTIKGKQSVATYAANEFGLYAQGASPGAIQNITVDRCSFQLIGQAAVWMEYVNGFRVTGTAIDSVGYGGVCGLSVSNGFIGANKITNILTNGTNGYGIIMSRNGVTSMVTDPRSSDIVIEGNVISGVVGWEGIDTHAGQRITISNNVVTNCLTAITATACKGDSGKEEFAPLDVTIVGNVIDSQVTDGSRSPGISFSGAAGPTGSDPAAEYGTGVIVGNVIKGHGQKVSDITGAIWSRNTMGLAIHANRIEEPSPMGICFYYDNRGFTVAGNTVTDPWSASVTNPSVVAARSSNNTGVVVGNTLCVGGKAATYKNVYGLYSSSGASSTIRMIGNSFDAATYKYGGAGIITDFAASIQAPTGTIGAPSFTFSNDTDTGIYSRSPGQIGFITDAAETAYLTSSALTLSDAVNISVGSTTGTRIGAGTSQKLAFYGSVPVAQQGSTPAAATDAATTQALVNDLRAKLLALGLIG